MAVWIIERKATEENEGQSGRTTKGACRLLFSTFPKQTTSHSESSLFLPPLPLFPSVQK
jgi:hypothetical protein